MPKMSVVIVWHGRRCLDLRNNQMAEKVAKCVRSDCPGRDHIYKSEAIAGVYEGMGSWEEGEKPAFEDNAAAFCNPDFCAWIFQGVGG